MTAQAEQPNPIAVAAARTRATSPARRQCRPKGTRQAGPRSTSRRPKRSIRPRRNRTTCKARVTAACGDFRNRLHPESRSEGHLRRGALDESRPRSRNGRKLRSGCGCGRQADADGIMTFPRQSSSSRTRSAAAARRSALPRTLRPRRAAAGLGIIRRPRARCALFPSRF